MITNRSWAVCLILSTALALVGEANAAPPEDWEARVKRLEKIINQQENRIAELEQQRNKRQASQREEIKKLILEVQKETGGGRLPNEFTVYWDKGIRMKTADDYIKIKLGGRLMGDVGWISGTDLEKALGTDLEDAAEFRRARLYAAGSIGKDLDFKLQFDFAGGDADLKDAYLKFKNIPFLGNVTIGHFKEPFSLENLTSSKYITFMERALPNVFAPGRSWGIMANDAMLNKRMTWAVGLFRDVDDFGEGKDDGEYNLTARVTGLPWYADKGRDLLHLGASYSLRHFDDGKLRYRERPEAHFTERFTDTGDPSPVKMLDGTVIEQANGIRNARWANLLGGEVAWVHGPFSVQGEFIGATVSRDGDFVGDAEGTAYTDEGLCFYGGYVYASYFLTGEHRNYKTSAGAFDRVKPKKNFREDGGWGAWEIGARYSCVNLDEPGLDSQAARVQNATIGLNWHLNPNMRLMWNYIHSCVDGRSDFDGEADILMMRVQVDF